MEAARRPCSSLKFAGEMMRNDCCNIRWQCSGNITHLSLQELKLGIVHMKSSPTCLLMKGRSSTSHAEQLGGGAWESAHVCGVLEFLRIRVKWAQVTARSFMRRRSFLFFFCLFLLLTRSACCSYQELFSEFSLFERR